MRSTNEIIIAIKNGEQVDYEEIKLACLVLNSLLNIGDINAKNLIKGGEIANLTIRKEFPGTYAEVGISQTESEGMKADPIKWLGKENIPGVKKEKEKVGISIDEAIAHCNEIADKLIIDHANRLNQMGLDDEYENCEECIAEHRQLAKWLEEYKELKKHKDEKFVKLARKVRELCMEYNAQFYFLTEGCSEWNISDNEIIKSIAEYHKSLMEKRQNA